MRCIHFNSTHFYVLLKKEHSLTYSQNDRVACFFETYIKAAIQVLRFIVCFVALRPKSTAMVMAGRSVHLTTLFIWATVFNIIDL